MKNKKNSWILHILKVDALLFLLGGLFLWLFPCVSHHVSLAHILRDYGVFQEFGMVCTFLSLSSILSLKFGEKYWIQVILTLFVRIGFIVFFLEYVQDSTEPHQNIAWVILSFTGLSILGLLIVLKLCYEIFLEKEKMCDSILSHEITLADFETNEGLSLHEMSHTWHTLVVFLRHFGCTFCRATLSELSKVHQNIELTGTRIVLVHMIEPAAAEEELKKYNLEHIAHISDPEKMLYKKFFLCRGRLRQLFGVKEMISFFYYGVLQGLGIGKLKGDGFQMPGTFLLYQDKVLKKHIPASASEIPPFKDMVYS